MPTTEEQYREHVLSEITGTTPVGFWRGYQERARGAYADAFSAVRADSQLNDAQRLSKLWQERHYKLEWVLIDEARMHGLAASDKQIVENGCAYSLVSSGNITMTQK